MALKKTKKKSSSDLDKEKKEYLNFKTTEEIEVPRSLTEQVIGQDEALEIIRKAAQQKRHILLLGEPGTGKSMLGKAMAEIISTKNAVDILSYPNPKDENKPIIKITKAGNGTKIIEQEKVKQLKNIGKGSMLGTFIFIIIGFAIIYYHYWEWSTNRISDIVYSGWIIADVLVLMILVVGVLISSSLSKKFSNVQNNEPKLIVDNSDKKMIFEDASGAHEGTLLGDVLHDPFQSGGLGTPAHQRVVAGMIHKANGGVLFIDEIATLHPEMQQELLTAMQEKKMPITGRSERSAGAMVRTTPVPTDFILVAAGNLDTLKNMHPALRSRIIGYGYEIYMNDTIDDNLENRKKLVRFVAQEVRKDGKIPHFTRDAVELIIEEAKRRSDKGGKLTARFRELGGIIRGAGDIAVKRGKRFVDEDDVIEAMNKIKSIEDQIISKYIEIKKKYSIISIKGSLVGKVNGLAVIGQTPPYTGMVMPIEAEVVKGGKGSQFIATGKLGTIAKESVTNVSALIKKIFGDDLTKDYNVYIQFIQTYSGVEGDSASIAVATAIVSALKNIPIKQDIAMTGSLSIRGEVLPIGGVSAKVEGAFNSGIKKIIIPKSNLQDLVVRDKIRDKIEIIPVENFYQVLNKALDWKPKDKKTRDKIKKLL